MTSILWPLYSRMRAAPGSGNRLSRVIGAVVTTSATGRDSSSTGGMTRSSASLASSLARFTARSLSPPASRVWSFQRILRIRYVRCRECVCSPNSSAKRSASWPAVMRSSAAISLSMSSGMKTSLVGVR